MGAQTFRSKLVKFVLPYPAGGFPNTVAQMLSKALMETWNQRAVIDNRPGGSGTVAALAIKAEGPADGYALLDTFNIKPALFTKLDYDAKKDFVPVTAPQFLAGHPKPAHSRWIDRDQ